jgi:hypothetical protein
MLRKMGNRAKVELHDRLEVHRQMGNSSHELTGGQLDQDGSVPKDLQSQSPTIGLRHWRKVC